MIPASAATKKTTNPIPVCVYNLYQAHCTVTSRGVLRTEDVFKYYETIGTMERKVWQRYNVELYRCALCTYGVERFQHSLFIRHGIRFRENRK